MVGESESGSVVFLTVWVSFESRRQLGPGSIFWVGSRARYRSTLAGKQGKKVHLKESKTHLQSASNFSYQRKTRAIRLSGNDRHYLLVVSAPRCPRKPAASRLVLTFIIIVAAKRINSNRASLAPGKTL